MNRNLALGMAVAGAALILFWTWPRSGESSGRDIRAAGPDQMRDPPPDWSEMDERLDESFPASDPPITY